MVTHYEHAKKEDPLGALLWAKTDIKISRQKMDIFHLARKIKEKDSDPFQHFILTDMIVCGFFSCSLPLSH